MLVLGVVRAVRAGVDAVVGQVQRRKKHDALAVDVFLDLNGRVKDALRDRRIFVGEQHGRFAVRQALERQSLGEDLIDEFGVVLVFLAVGQRSADFLIVDEFFGAMRARIVGNAHGW